LENNNMKWIRSAVFLLAAVALPAAGGEANAPTGVSPRTGSNAFRLQPQAILLDGAPITIVSVDDTTLVLKGDTKEIVAGRILVNSEGDGFLRKVIAVAATPRGLKVSTEQASLSDAFSSLDIKLDTKIDQKLTIPGTLPRPARPNSR
jgi:hypothetical protein